METLLAHSPLLAGFAVAALLPRRHRWALLVGLACGLVVFGYAVAFAEDDGGFIFTEEEFFVIIAVYVSVWWAAGVGGGVLARRVLWGQLRRRDTAS